MTERETGIRLMLSGPGIPAELKKEFDNFVIEKEQEKSRELIELSYQQDKFFSIIAHDLRSPFNSLLGFSEVLVADLKELDPEEIEKIVLYLNKSANNIFQLLNNLLDWSRIRIGRTEVNLQMVALNEIVVKILNLYQEPAKLKGITLKNKIFDDLIIKYDQNMLETIIRNLIGNAVKYCREDDIIVVSADQISEKLVQISVADSGICMSEEILSGLFQIDSDVKRAGTNDEPSTGLGLLLCKEFVELHGGKIWAISLKDKGSIFYLTIPIA